MRLLAALLVALASGLALAPAPEPRVRRLLLGAPAARRSRPSVSMAMAAAGAGAVGAIGAFALVGGTVGILLAVVCAVGVPRLARSLETRGDRRRREQLARQAPVLADLLAATMASGAPMRPALAAVAEAVGEPARSAIRPVISAIDLGAAPGQAWDAVVDESALAPIAVAVIRSMESGAPLAAILARIAEDMRRDRQAAVEVAAQAAGVRAVAPLAACFLPAFLLLGVVPVVAGLAGELLGS